VLRAAETTALTLLALIAFAANSIWDKADKRAVFVRQRPFWQPRPSPKLAQEPRFHGDEQERPAPS
jgi:hypothetical protein